ncbi:MAG: radical SAM protein [Oscillospiraceae bacterium]
MLCFYIDIKHNIRYDYCVTDSRLGGGRHHHAHWRNTETDAAGLPRQGRLYGVLSGCNLRCPYCHNPGLVLPEQSEGSEIPEAEVLSFLERRKGTLDGVCITGGEPTLQPELPEFLEKLRRLGYAAVKLDTNGTNPAMLKALLQERVLDYVAMDIKNSPSRYAEDLRRHRLPFQGAGERRPADGRPRWTTSSGTTVCAPLHTPRDMGRAPAAG